MTFAGVARTYLLVVIRIILPEHTLFYSYADKALTYIFFLSVNLVKIIFTMLGGFSPRNHPGSQTVEL